MSIEDDLFNMLRFASFGDRASPVELLHSMLRSMELNMLKQMKAVIDGKIKEISKEETAAKDEELNPFTILGVKPDASEEEVRKAYREKSVKAHPDKEGGSQEEMVKVNAAWETIRMFKGWPR